MNSDKKSIMKYFNYFNFLAPLLILLGVTSSGCEDYLADELLRETSADYLYNTPGGLEDAVVGLYNLNRDLYLDNEWNYARALTLPAQSDLAFGRTGEIALYAFRTWGRFADDFGSRRYDRFWRHYYRVIDRSNAVITAAEEVQWPAGEEDRRTQVLAEARMMRANSYFTLFRLFKNIYITTEPTTPENAFDVPQMPNTEEEIFALINSDLEFAIENLPWTTPDFGRWTQASARHVRAKTAAWHQDWPEVVTQTEAVINDPDYALVENTSLVFDGDLNHSETLFALQIEPEAIGGGNANRIHFNLVPQYTRIDGMRFDTDFGGRGAGLLLANDYLMNLVAEDPNDTRDDGTYYIRYYTYNDPLTIPDSVQIGDTVRVHDQYDGQGQAFYLTLGPGVLKYRQEDAVPEEANTFSNIMIYRLAETYLLAAEAHMELGNTAAALEYLNAVRNRAGAADLDMVDQTVILEERARELAFEGQRWFFLKRTGRLIEQIRMYAGNDNWRNAARERIEDHHINWSIPPDELDLLGPNYPQNPGYDD